ncbi:DNA adenine methylase [Agromyces sp. ZXT2-6]|uniref:DNA adenine methylase n=1 Tax=Agromyces sp. ZXT2-6 TaxID=3461153 RepID=UPI004054CF3F
MRFRSLSPLRYPGGKARLATYMAKLLRAQHPRPRYYAEPFAGGAGAALHLLAAEEVRGVLLNDLSPGIAAFWRSVFNETETFAQRIEHQELSLDAWHAARTSYFDPATDDFERGYATFLLNRFNRSGIIEAGPIGGLSQKGTWKVGARFNAPELAARIRYVGQYRARVQLSELDAREFVRSIASEADRTLLYVDPPYLVQGERLYLDSLTFDDHLELAEQLRHSNFRWLLTYDADDRIVSELYPGLRCVEFNISHTAHTQHVGSEYAVFSDDLVVPDLDLLPRSEARWIA